MARHLTRVLFAAAIGLLTAASAFAADWPTRPITVVVPFEQGGSVDRLARGLATYMQTELGQPVIVTNQPGAAGQVASTWLLHQPDDGYSVMMTPAIPYLAVNILATKARYTMNDFAFLNAQWTDFQLVAVPNDRPWKTLGELIDAIKATLDKTPPELAADIMDRGIVLAGGGALLQGLDQRIRQETHMPTHLAESPLTCVAVGSGRSLEEFEAMRNSQRARGRSRPRNGRR